MPFTTELFSIALVLAARFIMTLAPGAAVVVAAAAVAAAVTAAAVVDVAVAGATTT